MLLSVFAEQYFKSNLNISLSDRSFYIQHVLAVITKGPISGVLYFAGEVT